MPASEPQPIPTPLTEAAIFRVLTVDPGAESTVRDLLADASGLKRSVGFRIPDGAGYGGRSAVSHRRSPDGLVLRACPAIDHQRGKRDSACR
jgi:hypothetical protein